MYLRNFFFLIRVRFSNPQRLTFTFDLLLNPGVFETKYSLSQMQLRITYELLCERSKVNVEIKWPFFPSSYKLSLAELETKSTII